VLKNILVGCNIMKNKTELCFCDLDGTLIATDLLHEAIVHLIFKKPITFFKILIISKGSIVAFKNMISEVWTPDAKYLPYRKEVIDHLKQHIHDGGQVVLATASHYKWALIVASELKIFSDIIATDKYTNLKGKAKLSAIQDFAMGKTFSYIGDSLADVPILKNSNQGYWVGSQHYLSKYFSNQYNVFFLTQIQSKAPEWRAWLKALRVHQWAKNALLFLPAITGWGLFNLASLYTLTIVTVAFSLLSSGVYLLNDLSDVKADRLHSSKKRRPFAAGTLPVFHGLFIAAVLPPTAFLILFLLNFNSSIILMCSLYYIFNILYSFGIKKVAIYDIFTLAGFYLLRVAIGTSVLGLNSSFWFNSFLFCIFMELGLLKRYTEMLTEKYGSDNGRGYTNEHISVLVCAGISIGMTGAILLALYTQSEQISPVYKSVNLLVMLAPLILMHNLQLWLKASSGLIHHDPVMEVIKSPVSWLTALASITILFFARI
jgi:4-hydroxybenzoate polyprenyltransferase